MLRASRVTLGYIARGNLSSKRGNKNFYKGRGAPTMGFFARSGQFLIDNEKFHAKTFTCPDLTACQFKPYVSRVTDAVAKN